ncbi:HutD family protein [Rhizobium sp. 2YAF20]|uniref:HutD/Ves family protein n=1 Tax=Rhizobium sp. 2YAF20 TaxID=3233027 RepID=UPI003F9E331C
MKILRNKDCRRMPWKNGGGETVEIAVFPEGAALADFDWRVSMATVASDGPFSVFPGIDRTLSILDGEGMTLFIEDRTPVCLTRESEPLPFPADAATSATLVNGAITDLNVMTRRGVLSHRVERLAVDGTIALGLTGETMLLLCESGGVDLELDKSSGRLGERDCLILGTGGKGVLRLSGRALCYAIRIR